MVHEIKDWMSEMPIEQTVGAGVSPTHEEQGALREKLGDIRLDSDQVYLNAIQIMGLFTSVKRNYMKIYMTSAMIQFISKCNPIDLLMCKIFFARIVT